MCFTTIKTNQPENLKHREVARSQGIQRLEVRTNYSLDLSLTGGPKVLKRWVSRNYEAPTE